MSASTFADLMAHVGHEVEVTTYRGADGPPVNVAIECTRCYTVLLDFDNPGPTEFHLVRDGKVLATGTPDELFVWILRNTPFSNHEALTRQGYAMVMNRE